MLAHPQKCKLFTHNYNNKDDKTDTNSPRKGGGVAGGAGEKKKQNDTRQQNVSCVSRPAPDSQHTNNE